LHERLQSYIEQILGIYQCGFRVGKSASDQIHALRQILENTREHSVSTYHLFIDFKAAYDSTDRDKLFEAMVEFQIPKKLINLTKATLKRVWCRVKVNNGLSEPFKTRNGLRQGEALSCMLFNIAFEKAVRASGI
jgi:sorting nexin-29